MKRFIVSLAFLTCMAGAYSQTTVKRDAQGNYVPARDTTTKEKKPFKDTGKDTGKTYTDKKGNKYPVMEGAKGKLYIIRTSKNGNQYKQYLKEVN